MGAPKPGGMPPGKPPGGPPPRPPGRPPRWPPPGGPPPGPPWPARGFSPPASALDCPQPMPAAATAAINRRAPADRALPMHLLSFMPSFSAERRLPPAQPAG
ncbi:MAG: hypothetical protein F4156_14865 [Holophagales bacterium]|nr:hypothetical protein [Holophagales bacterium]